MSFNCERQRRSPPRLFREIEGAFQKNALLKAKAFSGRQIIAHYPSNAALAIRLSTTSLAFALESRPPSVNDGFPPFGFEHKPNGDKPLFGWSLIHARPLKVTASQLDDF